MDLDESIRLPRLRQRRDVNILNTVEEELDKDAHIIADSTGMPMWSVFLLFALVVLLVVGLVAFCFYRLFAKKRTKKDQKQKEELDEQAILDAMEEEPDDTELKVKIFSKDFLENIQYLTPGTRERVPGQTAVRAQVRLQHADPVSHSHPGHGAPSDGHGGSL